MTTEGVVDSIMDEPMMCTRLELSRRTGQPISLITRLANEVFSFSPQSFDISDAGSVGLYQEACDLIEERLPPPSDWVKASTLAEILETSSQKINSSARRLSHEGTELEGSFLRRRSDNESEPEQFLSPELSKAVKESIISQKERQKRREEQKSIEDEFCDFRNEMFEGETVNAEEFRKLVSIFGPDSIVDLIFQYRPDFSGVPVDMVSSFLTEYLGAILIERGRLDLDNLSLATEFLSNEKLKNSLVEVVKQHCLTYYQHAKRDNPKQDDFSIISDHLDFLREKITDVESEDLLDVLEAVEDYYLFLFFIDKPDNFVDNLTGDRPFPDLSQRINVGELVYEDDRWGAKMKRRMLFADDPGMGKSASAIMAKEHVGAKCALILSPSSMVETWKGYLSERVSDTGKQIGYFKPGQAPNVLVVDSPKDLEGVQMSDYDYVVLSHGRLKSNYTKLLLQMGFDMLIVDEAHEFKNIEDGQKAAELIELSDYVASQENSYTLMLTATPAPNKVSDIAMMLRVLHPEIFIQNGETLSNKEMIMRIIKGDYIDLRTLLVPRMQRKLINDSIKMPELYEEYHELELSEKMEQIYELYLEDDELTSSEKIQRLRQLLNNPATLDSTPDVESVKAVAVGEALRRRFKDEDKILMFVNDYVDNIISGEHTIHSTLQLPKDVKVVTLTGENEEREREAVRRDFQTSDGKMLLIVSGNISGLGVDLSAADRVVFYNEPWNKSLRRQQIGRAYRPGREKPLYVDTFYFPKTIEEGMMLYTAAKDLAIQKLLHGIKLSELEQRALEKEEPDESIFNINAELAAYYYSSWQRMLKMFGHVKEIGHEKFTEEFLPDHGVEYAKTYRELANRSYQANVARLDGALITNYLDSRKADPKKVRILDIASGPEVLRSHMPEEYTDSVISLDANVFHFIKDSTPADEWLRRRRTDRAEGALTAAALRDDGAQTGIKPIASVASMLDLPVGDSTVDYVNLSLALHYTRQVIKQGLHERVQALHEINRVLKKDGRATVTMIYSLDFEDDKKMEETFDALGFKIVQRDSGHVEAGENFKARVITVKKVRDSIQPHNYRGTRASIDDLPLSKLQKLSSGLKLRKTEAKVRDTKKIVDKFWFKPGGRLDARLNKRDQEVLAEETEIVTRMKQLRSDHGTIKSIPPEEIILNGFSRIYNGHKHVLFARLKKAVGSIVLR